MGPVAQARPGGCGRRCGLLLGRPPRRGGRVPSLPQPRPIPTLNNHSWLDASSSRTFDILAIYYGSDANFSCTACVAVYRGQGPKWQLIRQVLRSQEWHALHPRYGVVMLADDDVIMSTHVLSEAFRIFRARGLVLAQPSVCDHPQSSTLQPVVNQRKSLFMRCGWAQCFWGRVGGAQVDWGEVPQQWGKEGSAPSRACLAGQDLLQAGTAQQTKHLRELRPVLSPGRASSAHSLPDGKHDADLLSTPCPRYTAFVEIMVPMVRMDVLHRVIGPTLDEAYCGWGESQCGGGRGWDMRRAHGQDGELRAGPRAVLAWHARGFKLRGSYCPGSSLQRQIVLPGDSGLAMPYSLFPLIPRQTTGLDIVWPFLLGYPKDTVGIIDSVCAFHPAAQLDKVSTYGFQNPMAR